MKDNKLIILISGIVLMGCSGGVKTPELSTVPDITNDELLESSHKLSEEIQQELDDDRQESLAKSNKLKTK